jgi:T1SS-143 domain-containing protein
VGNLLTASAGATPVFTLELNATTGDWTFTLLAKLDHPDGSSENDIFLDFGEMIVATDNDGDIATGTGNLFIRIDDDSPSAFAETARTVAEDAVGTIDGNVLTNDAQGADGAVVTHVNLGSGFVAITSGTLVSGAYQFSTPKGVYTFKADGSWTFDPANNQNNASGIDASFSYRITDADGDVSEAVQPITITDGAGPSAGGPLTLALDDQNLARRLPTPTLRRAR